MKVTPPAPEAAAQTASYDVVIIIFGAAVRPDGTPSPTLLHRVKAAARLGARFERPLFIPTGAKGRHGDAEAIVMARLLTRAGVPDQAILTEESGTDTLSSVRAVRRLLPPTRRVYAATSAYHLARCVLLLRLAGVRARPCPPPRVPPSVTLWQRWLWRLRETPALPYDALLMLWLRITGRV